MNLTSAVNAFLRQSVRVGGMPFDLRLNEQQRETVLAMYSEIARRQLPLSGRSPQISIMMTKSVVTGAYTAPPADLPIMMEICGP